MRLLPFAAIACIGAYLFSRKRTAAPRLDPDERIGRSVRALLPDPDAVRVTVSRGIVSLRGTIAGDERDDLLVAVLGTPGVTEITNLLEVR